MPRSRLRSGLNMLARGTIKLLLLYCAIGILLLPAVIRIATPQLVARYSDWGLLLDRAWFNPFTFTLSLYDAQLRDEQQLRVLHARRLTLDLTVLWQQRQLAWRLETELLDSQQIRLSGLFDPAEQLVSGQLTVGQLRGRLPWYAAQRFAAEQLPAGLTLAGSGRIDIQAAFRVPLSAPATASWSLERFSLSGESVSWEPVVADGGHHAEPLLIQDLTLRVSGAEHTLSEPVDFTAALTLPLSRPLNVAGRFMPDTMQLSSRISLPQLALSPLFKLAQSQLPPELAGLGLPAGLLALEGELALDLSGEQPAGHFTGSSSLSELTPVLQGSQAVAALPEPLLSQLQLRDIRVELQPLSVAADISLPDLALSPLLSLAAPFWPESVPLLAADDGHFALDGQLTMDLSQDEPDIRFKGEMALSEVQLTESQSAAPALVLPGLRLSQLAVASAPLALSADLSLPSLPVAPLLQLASHWWPENLPRLSADSGSYSLGGRLILDGGHLQPVISFDGQTGIEDLRLWTVPESETVAAEQVVALPLLSLEQLQFESLPLRLSSRMLVSELALAPLWQLAETLPDLSLPLIRVDDGALSLSGQLSLQQPKTATSAPETETGPAAPMQLAITGDTRIDQLVIIEAGLQTAQAVLSEHDGLDEAAAAGTLSLAGWKQLAVEGIRYQSEPGELFIHRIGLRGPWASVRIDEEGQSNLARVMSGAEQQAVGSVAAVEETSAADTATPAEGTTGREGTERGEERDAHPVARDSERAGGDSAVAEAAVIPAEPVTPLDYRIEQITLASGVLQLRDASVTPPMSMALTALEGELGPLQPAVPARLALAGELSGFAQLSVSGMLQPTAPMEQLDLQLELSNLDLSPLSPYVSQVVGYGIDQGQLDLRLDYQIERQQLAAEHTVALNRFTLGEAGEQASAIGLPLPMAVALLKDSKGQIRFDLPLRGSLQDPAFQPGSLIVGELFKLIRKAATAPFSLLTGLLGGSEDVGELTFESGEATLDGQQVQQLQQLADILAQRPGLALAIPGIYSPQLDGQALRRLKEHQAALALEQALLAPELNAESGLSEAESAAQPATEPLTDTLTTVASSDRTLLPEVPAPVTVTEQELQQLAEQRAQYIRQQLVEAYGVAPQQIFIRSTPMEAGEQQIRDGQVVLSLVLTAG